MISEGFYSSNVMFLLLPSHLGADVALPLDHARRALDLAPELVREWRDEDHRTVAYEAGNPQHLVQCENPHEEDDKRKPEAPVQQLRGEISHHYDCWIPGQKEILYQLTRQNTFHA